MTDRDKLIEAMARGICSDFCEPEVRAWTTYVRNAEATLGALHAAGYAVVPRHLDSYSRIEALMVSGLDLSAPAKEGAG
jgi:hypothetical protein